MKKYGPAGMFFILAVLFSITTPAFAHKVNIFAYAEGGTVYTESYFPDGRKVREGLVEVYDSRGEKLLEGRTDQDGLFGFKSLGNGDLKIVITASMGHKNSYLLSSAEPAPAPDQPSVPETISERSEPAEVSLDRLKKVIDLSLDEKLKPIMRQLAAAREEEISFPEVIGGIGYIVGLTGILFYFLGKKKQSR